MQKIVNEKASKSREIRHEAICLWKKRCEYDAESTMFVLCITATDEPNHYSDM